MTLTCPHCESSAVELYDDNGAEYPQTRVEFYDCKQCGAEFSEVLTA